MSGELFGNFETALYQSYPAVACNESDGFVVTWSSLEQDGSNWGVFARRFGRVAASTAPVLSWLGLSAVALGLIGAGMMALRGRGARAEGHLTTGCLRWR